VSALLEGGHGGTARPACAVEASPAGCSPPLHPLAGRLVDWRADPNALTRVPRCSLGHTPRPALRQWRVIVYGPTPHPTWWRRCGFPPRLASRPAASPLPVHVRPAGLTTRAAAGCHGARRRLWRGPACSHRPALSRIAGPGRGCVGHLVSPLCPPSSLVSAVAASLWLLSRAWPTRRRRRVVFFGDARWSRCRRRPQGWGSSSRWTCQVHGYTRAPSVGVTWPRARTLSPRYVGCWAPACWVSVPGQGAHRPPRALLYGVVLVVRPFLGNARGTAACTARRAQASVLVAVWLTEE